MHQVIYQILRDTGRRPGEVVSLRTGCIEVIGGQHNLVYDNRKAGRMRRRVPVTAATAGLIAAWQQHRATLRVPLRWTGGCSPARCCAPASPRAPHPLRRGPGVQGLDQPDRCHRLRLPGPGGTPALFDPS